MYLEIDKKDRVITSYKDAITFLLTKDILYNDINSIYLEKDNKTFWECHLQTHRVFNSRYEALAYFIKRTNQKEIYFERKFQELLIKLGTTLYKVEKIY